VIGRSRDGGHTDTKACVDARLEPPPTLTTHTGTTPTGHIATVAHAEQSGQEDTKTRNAMATAMTASGGSVLQCQEDTILALMVIGRSRDGGHSDTKACVDAPHLLPPLHRAKSAWEMASGQEGTGMRTVSWTRNETIASGATVHSSEDTTVENGKKWGIITTGAFVTAINVTLVFLRQLASGSSSRLSVPSRSGFWMSPNRSSEELLQS